MLINKIEIAEEDLVGLQVEEEEESDVTLIPHTLGSGQWPSTEVCPIMIKLLGMFHFCVFRFPRRTLFTGSTKSDILDAIIIPRQPSVLDLRVQEHRANPRSVSGT